MTALSGRRGRRRNALCSTTTAPRHRSNHAASPLSRGCSVDRKARGSVSESSYWKCNRLVLSAATFWLQVRGSAGIGSASETPTPALPRSAPRPRRRTAPRQRQAGVQSNGGEMPATPGGCCRTEPAGPAMPENLPPSEPHAPEPRTCGVFSQNGRRRKAGCRRALRRGPSMPALRGFRGRPAFRSPWRAPSGKTRINPGLMRPIKGKSRMRADGRSSDFGHNHMIWI